MSVDRKTPLQGHHPVSGPRRCASPATKPCSCAAMPTKSAELGSHTGSPRCRDMTHVGHCKVVQSQAQGIETKHSVAEILGASSKKAYLPGASRNFKTPYTTDAKNNTVPELAAGSKQPHVSPEAMHTPGRRQSFRSIEGLNIESAWAGAVESRRKSIASAHLHHLLGWHNMRLFVTEPFHRTAKEMPLHESPHVYKSSQNKTSELSRSSVIVATTKKMSSFTLHPLHPPYKSFLTDFCLAATEKGSLSNGTTSSPVSIQSQQAPQHVLLIHKHAVNIIDVKLHASQQQSNNCPCPTGATTGLDSRGDTG
ncbi:hypothetical protein IWZ01DRAFT_559941 [Phyllosticta capitalensis]